jgi:hypothetical protein
MVNQPTAFGRTLKVGNKQLTPNIQRVHITNISINEDLVIKKIIKLEEEVVVIKETMATKNDIRLIMDGQDKMIRLMERWDDKRVLMNDAIKTLDKDVIHIKKHLQLA